MATYYIWQQGPAGNGTSPVDTRTSLPAIGNNDRFLFKRGYRFSFTNQLSITATGTYWGAFGDAADGLPEWYSSATNFGSINVSTPSGLTEFENIRFINYLAGSGTGAVINCAVNATRGRASPIKVTWCEFQSCAWNAILFNGTSTAEAAQDVLIKNNTFTDIGVDGVSGSILSGEISWNQFYPVSTRTTNGDGIGLINADPEFLWIHHNYINHSNKDSKQCIIVDTSGAPTGLAIIEDNELIGYGSSTQAPSVHSVIICDMPKLIRRNKIYGYGLICGADHPQDEITANQFYIGNAAASRVAVAINATGARVENNNFFGTIYTPQDLKTVTMANGVTGAFVRNNVFSTLGIAIKSDSAGNTPTATNNCFINVTNPRLDASNNAFAGGNDVTDDPQLNGQNMPLLASMRSGGAIVSGLDFYGKQYQFPPTIGAVQYQPASDLYTSREFITRDRIDREIVQRRVVGSTT